MENERFTFEGFEEYERRRQDRYAIYEDAMKPYKGGILSDKALHDSKLSKERLKAHADAVAWQAYHLADDLASSRSYAHQQADWAHHMTDRCKKLADALRVAIDAWDAEYGASSRPEPEWLIQARNCFRFPLVRSEVKGGNSQ